MKSDPIISVLIQHVTAKQAYRIRGMAVWLNCQEGSEQRAISSATELRRSGEVELGVNKKEWSAHTHYRKIQVTKLDKTTWVKVAKQLTGYVASPTL